MLQSQPKLLKNGRLVTSIKSSLIDSLLVMDLSLVATWTDNPTIVVVTSRVLKTTSTILQIWVSTLSGSPLSPIIILMLSTVMLLRTWLKSTVTSVVKVVSSPLLMLVTRETSGLWSMLLLTTWVTLIKTTLKTFLSTLLITITLTALSLMLISVTRTCTTFNIVDSLVLLISIKTTPSLVTTLLTGLRTSSKLTTLMVLELTLSLKSTLISGNNTLPLLVFSLLVKFLMVISVMLPVMFPLLVQFWTILGISTWEIFSLTKKICGLLETTTTPGLNKTLISQFLPPSSITTTILVSSPIKSSVTVRTETLVSNFWRVTLLSLLLLLVFPLCTMVLNNSSLVTLILMIVNPSGTT